MGKTEWIKCSDELPEQFEKVLFYFERDSWKKDSRGRAWSVGVGYHVGGRWHCDGYSRIKAYAWMPLPEIPTKDA